MPRSGVPSGATMIADRSRSRLRSRAGPVGGMSPVQIAYFSFVVLKVPATARPIAVMSLLNPSSSHLCPSDGASMP
jgi:hypothetical protein